MSWLLCCSLNQVCFVFPSEFGLLVAARGRVGSRVPGMFYRPIPSRYTTRYRYYDLFILEVPIGRLSCPMPIPIDGVCYRCGSLLYI